MISYKIKKKKIINKENKNSVKNNKPIYNTAIITIYRDDPEHNRRSQKKKFLEGIKKISYINNYDIYLIEQSQDNKKFNIGKLKNIGFDLANKSNKKYNFFIFIDIDILPDKKLIPYFFKKIRGVSCLAFRGSRYQNKDSNKDYNNDFFGSCLGFDSNTFEKINGYPNNFWGWGGEDDCLKNRCKINKINIYIPKIGKIIDLEVNSNNNQISLENKFNNLKIKRLYEENKIEKILLDYKIWNKNGLNSLNYDIINSKKILNENYELYYFKVNLKYDEDIFNNESWFELSSYHNLQYSVLKKMYNNLKEKLGLLKYIFY